MFAIPNSTLHISEKQRVGIATNNPRHTLDVNGFISVHEQVLTIPSIEDAQDFSINTGQLSVTGNRSVPFTLRLGPGINGQRLIIVNNLTCESLFGLCTPTTITIVNRDNTAITILNNTIAPGVAKEFIFSNNSWRAL